MSNDSNAYGTQSTRASRVGPGSSDTNAHGVHTTCTTHVGPTQETHPYGTNAVRVNAHVGPSVEGERNGSDAFRARAHVGLGNDANGSETVRNAVLNGNTDTRGLVGDEERERLATGFGAKLREMRKASGLSQARLGELAGIGVTHLSRLEQGRRRPSVDAIKALARIICGKAGPEAAEQKLAALAGDSLREGAARRKRQRDNKHRRAAAAVLSKTTRQLRKHIADQERLGLAVPESMRRLVDSGIAERLEESTDEPGIKGVRARDARRPRFDRPRSRSLKDLRAWLDSHEPERSEGDDDDEL